MYVTSVYCSLLQDTIRLLRRRDLGSGFRMCRQLLPMISRALSHVDKCVRVNDSCDVTASITRRLEVEEEDKRVLGERVKSVRGKVVEVRERVEKFGHTLDALLERAVTGETVGLFTELRLTFEMNRISALIACCEDELVILRSLLDHMDTQVAHKSLLATLLYAVCFLGSLGKSQVAHSNKPEHNLFPGLPR